MRWVLGTAVAVLFVAGGAVAQGDSSVPVDAEFEIDGPAVIVGDVELDAVLAGVLFHPAEDSGFVATVQDATVQVINVPYRLVMTQESSVVGKNWVAIGEEPELLWKTSFSGTIELVGPGGPESTIRVLPGGAGIDHAFEGTSLTAGAPMRFPTAAMEDRAALRSFSLHPVDSQSIVPDGVHAVVDGGSESFRGPLRAVLYGGEFLVEGTNSVRVATGHSLNSTITDPLGQVGAWRYDRVVLLVDAPTASVTLVEESGELAILVQRLVGSVSGDVALHGVYGTARSGEGMSSGRFALAQLIGNLTLDAEYDSTTRWHVGGEASYLALDANPVVGSREFTAASAFAEAAALSLLLLTAYAAVKALKVKGWFLAPLAARLFGRDICTSEPRKTIVAIVNATGMVPLQHVKTRAADAVGISTEAIRKHVDILCRNDVIARVQNGRSVYVGPNTGLYARREAQVAGALTAHEVGYAIGFAICSRPEPNQQEVVELVNACLDQPLSRVAIRNRIEDFAGYRDERFSRGAKSELIDGIDAIQTIRLIRKVRDGRHVRYCPTEVLRSVIEDKMSPRVSE